MKITEYKAFRGPLVAALLAVTSQAWGVSLAEVRWHDEATDTTKIENLIKVAVSEKDINTRVSKIARAMLETPYVGHTLEGSPEMLTVNMAEVDCTTFIEVVAALSRTATHRGGWRDFIDTLEKIRYRGGELNGYSSRLHYISEWSLDNGMRGTIKEVSRESPRSDYIVKTIDFMTRHRENYVALKDSAEFARIKNIEAGLRGHRFCYIKTRDLASKDVIAWIKDGDIVAFVSTLPDLDVTHLGLIVEENGKKKVLHASSKQKKVVISDEPLADFVKRGGYKGIRVFRVNED